MSEHHATQEAQVTVEAQVTRLMPCPAHAGTGNGECTFTPDGEPLQNPNGYLFGCPDCVGTPVRIEHIKVTGGGVVHEHE